MNVNNRWKTVTIFLTFIFVAMVFSTFIFVDRVPPSPSTAQPMPGFVFEEIANYQSDADVNSILIDGEYAYLAEHGAGLSIIDISNPRKPIKIGNIDTPGIAWKLDIINNTVFIADWDGGLRIVDVTNPEEPFEVGNYSTLLALDVVVIDNYAYITVDRYGFYVIDVSNKSNLQEISNLSLPGGARRLAVFSDYAYITTGYPPGLVIVDISKPTDLKIIGSYGVSKGTIDITVNGDYAYLSIRDSGLQIINVSNPNKPIFVGSYNMSKFYYPFGELLFYEKYINIRAGNHFLMFDVSNPTNPSLAGRYSVSANMMDIAVSENYVYIANGEDGFKILMKIIDSDRDQWPDFIDRFPNDPAASFDTDHDGYPNSWNAWKSESDSTTGLKLDAFPRTSWLHAWWQLGTIVIGIVGITGIVILGIKRYKHK